MFYGFQKDCKTTRSKCQQFLKDFVVYWKPPGPKTVTLPRLAVRGWSVPWWVGRLVLWLVAISKCPSWFCLRWFFSFDLSIHGHGPCEYVVFSKTMDDDFVMRPRYRKDDLSIWCCGSFAHGGQLIMIPAVLPGCLASCPRLFVLITFNCSQHHGTE